MSVSNGVTLQPEGPLSTVPVRSVVGLSDSVIFPDPTRSIFVGGAGNLKVLLAGDPAPITLTGIAAGSQLTVAVVQIFSTGSTATNVVALF